MKKKDEFIKQVNELYEVDIGDFKRKLILYLTRLEESLENSSLQPQFDEIRMLITCNNTREINELREQVLESIKQIE